MVLIGRQTFAVTNIMLLLVKEIIQLPSKRKKEMKLKTKTGQRQPLKSGMVIFRIIY